ncbi:MAG: TIGR03809 family protein [Bradyrhizobium sp.]|nr:TIGR03809 family protein [Bradyrhizobium sp.]
MTDRTDVARARDIVARWSALAEQRLDYLTELFETGRWRRYHSESVFLENIREAKSAVETWRGLLNNEATPDNRPVDISWLGRGGSVPLAKREVPITQGPAIAPQLAQLAAAPSVSVVPAMVEPEPQPDPVLTLDLIETTEESAYDQTLALTLDIVAMADRYPLLSNAFQQPGNG